jgi:hypothetical protein
VLECVDSTAACTKCVILRAVDKIPFDPYDFFGYLASGLLVLAAMQLLLGFPQVPVSSLGFLSSALLLLGTYVAGQIVATPAKAVLEDLVVDKILGPPSINLLAEKKPPVKALLFPGYYKSLPEATRRKVLEKATSEGVSLCGEELFAHVRYGSQVINNQYLVASLGAFLSRYGFSRNLAFTSVIAGVAFLCKGWFVGDHDLLKYAATAILAGVLLFYRYLKFMRQYSYELFSVYGWT